MFSLVLLTSSALVSTCGRRWVEEPEKWIGNRRFIFLLPSSCASRSAQNAAFALLGSLSACYAGYYEEKLL